MANTSNGVSAPTTRRPRVDGDAVRRDAPGPPALFALMRAQHGVASRRQARRAGVSAVVERRLVAEGALVRALPDVLAAGGVPLTFGAAAMAATLRCGAVAISHGAAARLHRLPGFERYAGVDVLGDRGNHPRPCPPIIVHYTRGPIDSQLVRLGSIPVTSLPLTLSMVLPGVDDRHAVAMLHDALARGLPVVTIGAVAEAWRRHGRAGPTRLLALLDGLASPDVGRGARAAIEPSR